MKYFLTVVILFLSVVSLFSAHRPVKAEYNDHVRGQLIVKFRKDIAADTKTAILRAHGAAVQGRLDFIDALTVSVPDVAEDKVLTALQHNPNVEYAESDGLASVLLTPSDTYFPLQWGLANAGQTVNGIVGVSGADIHASNAWDKVTGGSLVAVLDTGIRKAHSDLSGAIVNEANFSDATTGTEDIYGHGTHVAGIIAARINNAGVVGVCPSCTLLNGKVLNDSGSGAYSWIVNGIGWAVTNHAQVISMSLGGPTKSRALEDAVNRAWNAGVVVVAAAGNSANQSKTYPGAYTNVISVAATDNRDRKASFSSFGKWVDVAAPGSYIYSTWNDATSSSDPQPVCVGTDCFKYTSGTSMATPMVSGLAGLVWASGFGTSASSVRTRIETTADRITGTGTYWIYGRINADRAVTP